jgi:hypothetical protein
MFPATPVAKRPGSADRTVEHARVSPQRAYRSLIRHHCSVALAQKIGDGRINFYNFKELL